MIFDNRVLVSIIIPCYNAGQYIYRAIESALGQTYPHIEIIVIDDGSNDESLEVINSFGDKVSVFKQSNQGACVARNLGINNAKGKYLQFLDADDFLHEGKVAEQVEILERNELSLANGVRVDFSDENNLSHFESNTQNDVFFIGGEEYLTEIKSGKISKRINPRSENGIGHSYTICWLVARELAKKIGGWDPSLAMVQDTDFFTRAAVSCDKLAICPGAFAYYRISSVNSISKGKSRKHAESYLKVCDKMLPYLKDFDSELMRISLAGRYAGYLFSFFGKFADLDTHCLRQIRLLKVEPREIWPGRICRTIAAIFGVRGVAYYFYGRRWLRHTFAK